MNKKIKKAQRKKIIEQNPPLYLILIFEKIFGIVRICLINVEDNNHSHSIDKHNALVLKGVHDLLS